MWIHFVYKFWVIRQKRDNYLIYKVKISAITTNKKGSHLQQQQTYLGTIKNMRTPLNENCTYNLKGEKKECIFFPILLKL